MLHKKVKKFIKKAIPKEIKPFVPAVAGMFLGPAAGVFLGKFGAGLAAKGGMLGGIGSLLSKPMVAGALGRGLVDVGAQALTSDRIDPFSAAMSAGLGALSEYQPGSVFGKADELGRVRKTGGLRGGLDRILTKGRELGRVGRLDDAGFDFIKTGKLANLQGTTKAASDELAIQKETAKKIAMESAAFQAADSAGRREAIVQAMLDAGFDNIEANAAATEEGYAMGGRVGFERGGTFQAAQQALGLFDPRSVIGLGGNMARRDIQGNRVLYGRDSLSDEYQGLDDLGRSLAMRTLGGGRGRGRVMGSRFGMGPAKGGIAGRYAQGSLEGRKAFAEAKAKVEQQRRADSRAALDAYGLSDVTDTQADAISDALRGFYTGRGPTAFGGINTGGVTGAEAVDAARQAREMATRQFGTFLEDNPGLAQTIQGGITDFVRGTVGREMRPQTSPVEDEQAEEVDLFEYAKLAGLPGFEEGGQVGMPERGGGANEEAMADLMMKLDSGEFYLDEEGNLRRIPRRRPRMNTRPGMNEDAIADQMFMMQMNERMGRKEGGTVPGLPAGRQVDAREGTFIPMGGAKRADDVPAMLSVNEFVLNDDAVAGLGKMMTGKPDPRAGARALYKIQDQLEAMV